MRWTGYRGRHLMKWTRWFAWHPVLVGNRWVWLERVERYLVTAGSEYGWCWKYRFQRTTEEMNA